MCRRNDIEQLELNLRIVIEKLGMPVKIINEAVVFIKGGNL